jgi:hypothetical protein
MPPVLLPAPGRANQFPRTKPTSIGLHSPLANSFKQPQYHLGCHHRSKNHSRDDGDNAECRRNLQFNRKYSLDAAFKSL